MERNSQGEKERKKSFYLKPEYLKELKLTGINVHLFFPLHMQQKFIQSDFDSSWILQILFLRIINISAILTSLLSIEGKNYNICKLQVSLSLNGWIINSVCLSP